MNDFWFWFLRPLAETLGALALIALIFILFVAWHIYDEWKAGKKRNATER